MTVAELLFLSVGLAADAFAASVCRGLAMKRLDGRRALLVAAFFGVFQMLMPLLGWLFGSSFADRIGSWDHWVAFLLLALIGGKMIRDSFAGEEDARPDDFSFRTLLLLAVATSIDALAVGVTFAMLEGVDVLFSASVIGTVTFLLSLCGVLIGNRFGDRNRGAAERIGGAILILVGLKILLEGLGLIK